MDFDQIKQRNYAAKYRAADEVITGMGVNFNAQEKGIDGWLEMEL